MRFINVGSHVSSSENNNFNISKSDNVIVNSNLPHINDHTKSSLNKLITLQKETDTDSSTSINDEIMITKIQVNKYHIIKIQQN